MEYCTPMGAANHHHVDDDMYADIGPQKPQAVAASMLALYNFVGSPDSRQPMLTLARNFKHPLAIFAK